MIVLDDWDEWEKEGLESSTDPDYDALWQRLGYGPMLWLVIYLAVIAFGIWWLVR